MGSEFWFTVRFAACASGTPALQTRPSLAQADSVRPNANETPSRPELILVVDDNRVNRLLAAAILRKLGYRSDEAADGRQAVEIHLARPYDLILMDCMMPVMDGFSAARAIRVAEAETGGHVPIIALTASVIDGDRDKCHIAGMDDFVAKPFRQEDLEKALNRWLKAPPAG